MPRLLNGLTDSFAFEKLTVSSTVKTLTASVYHQKSSTNAPNKIALGCPDMDAERVMTAAGFDEAMTTSVVTPLRIKFSQREPMASL